MTKQKPELYDFYCAQRLDANTGTHRSLYQIWEDGAAFNDSITPSTYCSAYRGHLVKLIQKLDADRKTVFSIGCGNAFVERDLVQSGYSVDAIDCNQDAVDLAISKDVNAVAGDYLQMAAGSFAGYDVIYADGFLGHLYDSERKLESFFRQLHKAAAEQGTWLVFSNDAPVTPGRLVEPHPSVSGFWMISGQALSLMAIEAGYEVVECYAYDYVRPISGTRHRTICIARVSD